MTMIRCNAPARDADLAAQPFDELIAELQRIVQALEAGNVGPGGDRSSSTGAGWSCMPPARRGCARRS